MFSPCKTTNPVFSSCWLNNPFEINVLINLDPFPFVGMKTKQMKTQPSFEFLDTPAPSHLSSGKNKHIAGGGGRGHTRRWLTEKTHLFKGKTLSCVYIKTNHYRYPIFIAFWWIISAYCKHVKIMNIRVYKYLCICKYIYTSTSLNVPSIPSDSTLSLCWNYQHQQPTPCFWQSKGIPPNATPPKKQGPKKVYLRDNGGSKSLIIRHHKALLGGTWRIIPLSK